jgi:hypothetical protein
LWLRVVLAVEKMLAVVVALVVIAQAQDFQLLLALLIPSR